MKKWRKFWINKPTMVAELVRENILISDPRRQLIHVIETGAVEELKRKLKLAIDMLKQTKLFLNMEDCPYCTSLYFQHYDFCKIKIHKDKIESALDAINEEEG